MSTHTKKILITVMQVNAICYFPPLDMITISSTPTAYLVAFKLAHATALAVH